MRVIQTKLLDLFTIMDCNFQLSIRKAIMLAVGVQITFIAGESEYQSTCAYYYCFYLVDGGFMVVFVPMSLSTANTFRRR
jgi:uncharacterized membrane protein